MLTAEQISALGDQVEQILSPVIDFLIGDIAERISEAGQLTSTASYQVWRLQQLGVSQAELKQELQKRLRVSAQELERLMTQAAEVGYNFDLKNLPHAAAIPFAENEAVQQFVKAAIQLAQDDLTNMTQTLGFVGPDNTARTLTQAYQNACDFAFQKVALGAQDYNSAIREATRGLAEKGIVTINYDSGVHTELGAAVRRSVMGGLGLMQEQIRQQNHDDMDCDGWEISAHAASAPDHEPIQGRQYSDEAYEKLNNSLVRRIGTLNCGHDAFPIILGVNSPQYTPEQLEQMRADNEKGIDYEGKHYTMYKATQRQRTIENKIRVQKRRILVDEKTGDDEKLQIDRTKYVRYTDEYNRFSKAAGLRTQQERLYQHGFGPKQAKAAESVGRQELEKYSRIRYNDNGTIVVTDDWKSKAKPSIPRRYKPNAIIETKTEYKNGVVQIDRTIYGSDAMMKTQIHSGPHNRLDQHPFGEHGEHVHTYTWVVGEEKPIIERRNFTDAEKDEHADILKKEAHNEKSK